MHIGDLVTYEGRLHYLRGVEPFSVAEPQADLEDCETGRQRRARLSEVVPADRSQEKADLAERAAQEGDS